MNRLDKNKLFPALRTGQRVYGQADIQSPEQFDSGNISAAIITPDMAALDKAYFAGEAENYDVYACTFTGSLYDPGIDDTNAARTLDAVKTANRDDPDNWFIGTLCAEKPETQYPVLRGCIEYTCGGSLVFDAWLILDPGRAPDEIKNIYELRP